MLKHSSLFRYVGDKIPNLRLAVVAELTQKSDCLMKWRGLRELDAATSFLLSDSRKQTMLFA